MKVGTFVWPNGQRTMCWFYEGSLVLSQTMTANEQASFELTYLSIFVIFRILSFVLMAYKEERKKFESCKKEEEAQWKASQQRQRETEVREKAEQEEKFQLWMSEEKKKLLLQLEQVFKPRKR